MSPVRPARAMSRARRAAFAAAVVLSAQALHAQTPFTWNGAGPDGLLSTDTNWVGSTAPATGANTSLIFGDASARFTINVPAGFSTQSLTFTSTNAYSFVGSTLTLGNTTADEVVLSANGIGTPNFNHPIAFANPSIVQAVNSNIDFNTTVTLAQRVNFNAAAGRAINFSGPLDLSSASSVLRATGPGTVTLFGGNNAYAAGASVVASGGTLIVTSGTQVPNLVLDGGLVRLQTANRLAGLPNVSVSAGQLDATGVQSGSVLSLTGGTVTASATLSFASISAVPSAATPARLSGPFSTPLITGSAAASGATALDIDGPSVAASVTYAAPGVPVAFRFLPGTSASPFTQSVAVTGDVTFQLAGGTPAAASGVVTVPANASLTFASPSNTTFLTPVSSTGSLTVGPNVTLDNPSAAAGSLALTGGTVRLLTAGRLTAATAVSVSSGSLQVSANQTGSTLSLAGGSVTGTGTVSFSSLIAAPPQFTGVGQSAATPRLATPFNIPSFALNPSPLVPVTLDLEGASLAPTVTYSSSSPNLPTVRFFSFASTTSSVTVSGTGAVLSFQGGSPATNGATFTVAPGARFQLHYQGVVSPFNGTFVVSGTLEPATVAGFAVALRNVSVAPSGTFVATASLSAVTLTNTGSVSVPSGSALATASVLNSGVITSTSTQTIDVGTLSNTPSGVVSAVALSGTVINAGTYTVTRTSGPSVVGSYTHQPGAVLNVPTNPATGTASFEVLGVLTSASLTLNAPFSVPANAALRASNSASLVNNSALSLAGGTLGVGGSFSANNASITGFGTLSSSTPAGLTNNGTFSVTGPLVLTGSAQLFNRVGVLDLAPGSSLSATTTLTNAATFNLRGASLSANLSNTSSGVVTVSGTFNSANFVTNSGLLRVTAGTSFVLNSPLTNAGSLRIDDGTLNLNSPGQISPNSGLITLGADGALVGSGIVNSTGRLTGAGTVGLSFNNATGGRVEPSPNASLTFLGTFLNAGVLSLPQGTSAVLLQGFSGNANNGTISLAGGSLDTNYTPFSNTRLISGFGSLSASVITNNASIFFTPGTSVVNANVTNTATNTISLNSATVTFNGRFSNLGTLDILAGSRAFFPGANLSTPLSDARPLALTGVGTLKVESGSQAVVDGLDAVLAFTLGASTHPSPILVIPSRQPGGVIPAFGRTVPQSVSVATIATSVATFLPELPGQLSYLFRLDLTDNDMVMRFRPGVFNPSVTLLRDMARNYLSSDGVRGIGVSSSLPFTRLAVVPNDSGFGFTRFASFGADLPLLASDVILRFTYIGDTDLSGTLDARDFNNVLSGWSNARTGWENGDFNYDNVVNATDFQLFLEAYQAFQSGTLPNLGSPLDYNPGPGASIPEPAALSLLALPALALRRRPRRQ